MQNDCNCWQILILLSHGFKDSLGSSSGPAGSTECQRLYGVRSTDQDDINYSNIRMDGMVSHSFDRIGLVCHSRSWIHTYSCTPYSTIYHPCISPESTDHTEEEKEKEKNMKQDGGMEQLTEQITISTLNHFSALFLFLPHKMTYVSI